jgi:hypothetical protein
MTLFSLCFVLAAACVCASAAEPVGPERRQDVAEEGFTVTVGSTTIAKWNPTYLD